MVGPIAGRESDGDGEHGEADGLLRFWQSGQHGGEGHGDQHAAGKPLESACNNHRAEIVGEGAGHRKDGEQDGVRQNVAAEGKDLAKVIGERDDDDFADQVGRRYPGPIVNAGPDAPFDVEQGGVSDLDVQDRHEGADHHGADGDPGGKARLSRGGLPRWKGRSWRDRDGGGFCGVRHGLPPKRQKVSAPAGDPGLRSRGPGVDGRNGRHPRAQHGFPLSPPSRMIFTGMRCTTLVKLPVALSGGSKANSCPLAGASKSTRPLRTLPGNMSTSISAAWPGRTSASCVSL